MTAAPVSRNDAEALKLATGNQWDACAKGWNDSSALIRN